MARSSITIATALAITLAGAPAVATVDSPATASYNPWLAAGLTFAPSLLESAALVALSGTPNEGTLRSAALFVTVNPFPGLGHVYVGEPTQGLALFGIDMGLAVTTLAVNIALYQGRLPTDQPLPWQEQVRQGVTFTSMAAASTVSLWAAWDAYRIAEEKDRPSQ